MAVNQWIMPDRVSVGFKGGPIAATARLQMESGQVRRKAIRSLLQWRYVWELRNASTAQADAVRDFFMETRGGLESFLFKDHRDYSGTGEAIGIGDGSIAQFQAVRNYGSNNTYQRVIRHIVDGSLAVYADGVLQGLSGDYEVDSAGLITFYAAPGPGVVITADFEFYVPCRFEDDVYVDMMNHPAGVDVVSVEDMAIIEVLP